jgi:hypothetical protein
MLADYDFVGGRGTQKTPTDIRVPYFFLMCQKKDCLKERSSRGWEKKMYIS